MNSIKEAQKTLDDFAKLQELADPIATVLIGYEGHGKNVQIFYGEIGYNDGCIVAPYSTYCCGCNEDFSIIIPLEYLFDSEWKEKAEAEHQRKLNEKAERKRLAKIEKDKKDLAIAERNYLRIKAKVENTED